MQISVALDGSKRRDIKLYQGDSSTIELVVYKNDGDESPIQSSLVTAISMTTVGPFEGTIPVGGAFNVPAGLCGRNWYTIKGVVDGAATTLAFGWILGYGQFDTPHPWGNDYGWRWPFGPGNCEVLP